MIGVLFVGSLVYLLLASRPLKGSIPGRDSILSLAAIHQGFLVGTTGGLFASRDGGTWAPARIPRQPVAVTSDGLTSYVLAGGDLKATVDLHTFNRIASGVTGTVLAVAPGGGVYVGHGRSILLVGLDGAVRHLGEGPPGDPQILALAASPDSSSSLAAGGVTGFWRSADAGATWVRVLQTPVQALLYDPANHERILLATPGGVLVSSNGGARWEFTELRLSVHGLSQEGGKFFAVTTDRVIYGSTDGVTGWRPFTPH